MTDVSGNEDVTKSRNIRERLISNGGKNDERWERIK